MRAVTGFSEQIGIASSSSNQLFVTQFNRTSRRVNELSSPAKFLTEKSQIKKERLVSAQVSLLTMLSSSKPKKNFNCYRIKP